MPHDKDLSQALKQISTQIGRVLERQEFTEQLEQSEARFRDFAASTGDRFWQTDINHRFTYVSEPPGNSSERHSSEKMLGKTRWDLDHENPHSEFWLANKADMDAHKPFYNLHYSRTFPDGSKTFIRSTGLPIFDENNEFIGYRGTNLDETDYVQSTQQADEIQRRLFNAMEELNAGFTLWDADNKFVSCNSFYKELHRDVADILIPGISYEDYILNRYKSGKLTSTLETPEEWLAARRKEVNEVKSEYEYQTADQKWFRIQKYRLEDGYFISF